jgi:hypothetical protein
MIFDATAQAGVRALVSAGWVCSRYASYPPRYLYAHIFVREDWEAWPFHHTFLFLETSRMTGFLMKDVSQQLYIMVVQVQLQSVWRRAAQRLWFRFSATKDSGASSVILI